MSCNSPYASLERRRLMLGALATLVLPARHARANRAPPEAPSEVAAQLPRARRQGRGTFRWWGLPVYDAELWTEQPLAPDRYDQAPFALALHYARALAGQQIAERSLVEMRRIGPVDDTQARTWLAALRDAFPDVTEGDRLVGLHRPGEPTRFFCNGQPTRSVNDPAFAPLFFGIWLSPRSTEPALRQALYGPAR